MRIDLRSLSRRLLVMTLLCVCVIYAAATAASPESPSDDEPLTILPLGDSRVAGSEPSYQSYRYALWELLIAQGLVVDFVGPRADRFSYPRVNGLDFDPDHAGVPADTTRDVLERVRGLASEPPDLVLLGIGGNDLMSGESAAAVSERLERIILELQSMFPGVVIIVEQIAPARMSVMPDDRVHELVEFNSRVASIARELGSPDSAVLAVDMASGWTDSLLADEVHYNEAGAAWVASRYLEAIESLFADE